MAGDQEVRTEVTEGAMREFFIEFNRLRDEKVPVTELEEKKRSVVARFAFSLESPQSVLVFDIKRKVYGLPEDYWDKYPAQISAVTADDVQRVAKQYLTLDKIQMVAVGDAFEDQGGDGEVRQGHGVRRQRERAARPVPPRKLGLLRINTLEPQEAQQAGPAVSRLRVQGDPRGPGGPPYLLCYGTGGAVPGEPNPSASPAKRLSDERVSVPERLFYVGVTGLRAQFMHGRQTRRSESTPLPFRLL